MAKKSTAIIILSVIVGIVAVAEIPNVPWEADMMASFSENSEPRSSDSLLQSDFGGSQLFTISFLADDIRELAILDQMVLLEKRLRVLPHVHFPQSAVNLVTMMNRLFNDQPGLPDTRVGVSNLWFLLEGQAHVEMMVASNFKEGIVQARIDESRPAVVRSTLKQIERLLKETVKTDLVTVSIAAQPDHLRQVFLKQIADRIAEKVVLDIKFHTGFNFSFKEHTLSEAFLEVFMFDPMLDPYERQKIVEPLIAYFQSEEADLGVDLEYNIAHVGKRFNELNDFSEPAFLYALKEVLPSSLWQQAPEAIHEAAVSAWVIMENEIKDWRHQ